MTREEKALSYAGWLNFVNGRWIKKRPALIVQSYLHPGARGEKANAAVSKTVGATLGGSTPPAPTIHRCHWPGCVHEVPPRLWGCRFHWFKLPKELRDAVWRAYVPGQEVTKTPSPEYIKVAKAVQDWIKEQGGRA